MRLMGLMVAGLLVIGDANAQQTPIERGKYLARAAGCVTCHTANGDNAVPLAGGHRLETPFGTFYGPNITPDKQTGIGDWSDEDFLNAIWNGVSPDGENYYPAFPYTSYTGMSREDALAIKAYLFSLDPVSQENREHELNWYVSMRMAAGFWKSMGFNPARFSPDASRSDEWNRGAYLVRHLGHCGECHTPRDVMGRMETDRDLHGNPEGGEKNAAPDITPNKTTGIGKWSVSDIEFFLEIGMLPDGDFTGGNMSAVIDDNTSLLTPQDRNAIAVYLKSLPASGS
jgi:mono/diheme cytochrome c family protein